MGLPDGFPLEAAVSLAIAFQALAWIVGTPLSNSFLHEKLRCHLWQSTEYLLQPCSPTPPKPFLPEKTLAKFSFFSGTDVKKESNFSKSCVRLIFGSDAPSQVSLDYPIACSGPTSDFCLVPRNCFAKYIHITGVLAAAGLFVEMSCATALVLACDEVRTAKDATGQIRWEVANFNCVDAALAMLLTQETIAIHPVKLSTVLSDDRFVRLMRDMRKIDPAKAEVISRVLALEPKFDGQDYLDANIDVAEACISPYEHYLNFGLREGRSIHPAPKTQPSATFTQIGDI